MSKYKTKLCNYKLDNFNIKNMLLFKLPTISVISKNLKK